MPQHGETQSIQGLRGFRTVTWLPCGECGKYYWAWVRERKPLICRDCFGKVGSKRQDGRGRIWIKLAEDNPYYPMAHEWYYFGRGWVMEHRLVMAKHLERCLETEEKVYRLNLDQADNRIENLSLKMSKAQRMKAFRAVRARTGRRASQLI